MSDHERSGYRDTSYLNYRDTFDEGSHHSGYWLEVCILCNQTVAMVVDHEEGIPLIGKSLEAARAMWRVARMASVPMYIVRWTWTTDDISGFEVITPGETSGLRLLPSEYVRWLVDLRSAHYAAQHPHQHAELTEHGPIRPVHRAPLKKSLAYSGWHRIDSARRYASDNVATSLKMIDLDHIEVCAQDGLPVALIETAETKRYSNAPNECKFASILVKLGLKVGLPVFSVNYLARNGVVHALRVQRQDRGRNPSTVMTPEEYRTWLGSLRLDHDLRHHITTAVQA